MIFPFFRGVLAPYLAPATWFFLAINLIVFIANLPKFVESQNVLEGHFRDSDFMRTQGAVYAQFVRSNPGAYSPFILRMAGQAASGDETSRLLMAGYAMREKDFMTKASDMTFTGDAVALAAWKRDFAKLRELQDQHPTYTWGLSAARPRWNNWITYQFAHSGLQHLLWNMAFLVLFGTFLETLVGSSLVVLVYVFSGLAGAGFFAFTSGLSYSPLVGASGCISGLMACLAVYLWQQPARFFFWLLPIQGYFGMREFPAWLIVVVYLVPDLAGYVSALPEANGLAYSAHLGGAALGAAAGYAIRRGWLEKEDPPSAQSNADAEESW